MRASAGLYRPVRVMYWMRPAARPEPPLLCMVRAKCVVAIGYLLCAPEGVGAFLCEKRLLHSHPAGTAGATPGAAWAQPGHRRIRRASTVAEQGRQQSDRIRRIDEGSEQRKE